MMAGAVVGTGQSVPGTFGTVVAIGGEAADVALDQSRGVLYIANFTANRIEVMSLATNTIQTSINVAPQPGSISLSPDAHWLLVAHFGNNTAPQSPANALTLIDLTANNSKQTIALGNPPLGVAFGLDDKALVVTTQNYILFDPTLGTTTQLDTIANVAAQTLPVPPATFPGNITNSSVAASADALHVYGMGSSSGTFTFRYDVATHTVSPGGVVLSSGTLGPRVVSMNQNGTSVMVGWLMIDSAGTFINDVPQRSNQFSVGTNVFDNTRGLVYAQIPATAGEAPNMQILAADNLQLIDRLQLPENTTGKSVMTSDSNTMYSVSDSGVLVLPVGNLNASPRLAASVEDLDYQGTFCTRNVQTQTLTITDPGGGNTPFSITPSVAGVTVSPSSGITPAIVNVQVNPNAFAGQSGTVVASLAIASSVAVNLPPAVRVLINTPQPDQRGSAVDVPGQLADVIADPIRNRYYIIRQDKNLVLVYDGTNNTLLNTMRTYNVPSSLAITQDNQYLLVGHEHSQTVAIYDLDTWQMQPYISTTAGAGNVVRSMAVTTNGILATSEDYQLKGHIIQLNLLTHDALQLPTLGVYQNLINPDSMIATSSNASKAVAATADGITLLYDANVGTFTASRQDFKALAGPIAASPFNQYLVGANLLDASLVPSATLETATGTPSGFAFVDQTAVRTTAPNTSSPGIVQGVTLSSGAGILPTRMVEAPLLNRPLGPGESPSVFTRTLTPLQSRTAYISLTVSGFTVLPWAYSASVAPPQITQIVSAADGVSPVAPGGLIEILGNQLSATNLATNEIPMPTALANSCLTVNGQPMPLVFVSPSQINAQMPAAAIGAVTVNVHTPGGVSDNFNLTVQPTAPAVFLSGVAGPVTNIPTVIRAANNQLVTDSNPIQHGDTLVIYFTGCGQTTPIVGDGLPAPSNPFALTLIPPSVQLGGQGLPMMYSGLAPGQVGVCQINATVPRSVPAGLGLPLTITQGASAQTLSLRVIE
jgi:uncharacterized protein (TIGR03437 family)